MSLLERLGRAVLTVIREGFDVVRNTISLGILSIALAIAIWFFVIDVENETRRDFFPGVIAVEAVNVPQGLAVSSISEPFVRVRISADKDVWNDISTDDFRAIIDLSGMKQRETSVSVRVSVNRGDVDVDEVDPREVVVNLEPVTTRTVPVEVRLVGAAPLGYSLAESEVSPEEISISGPASLVDLVDAAVADVNLTNIKVDLKHEFTLTPRDAQGGDISGVNLDPNTAEVSLTIVKEEFSVVYIVNPSISGNAAPGYKVTAVEVDPAFVSVSGSLEVLQSIDTLTTENVTVDGAESDVVRSVRLRLPEGARVANGEEVVVRVRVGPAQGESAFTVAVKTSGAEAGVLATVVPSTVSVTVAGEMPVLQTLTADEITVTVDLSDLSPGTHRLAPVVELPAGLELVGVDPVEVVVTVSSP